MKERYSKLKITEAATGGVLKKFANFTGKHLEAPFNKVAGPQDSNTGAFL